MVIKEECRICGRVLPYYSLRRCFRCGKLYCKACLIIDATSENRNVVCLNCARRIVSPKKKSLDYGLLTRYLLARACFTDKATLSIPKIEGILANNLPFAAIENREWWSNSQNSAHARAWLNAGWQVETVDLENRTIVFRKIETLENVSETAFKKRRRFAKRESKKPFVPPEPKKIRKYPTKTKIARVQARFKNIERQRLALKAFGGKAKQKTAYEKRLYMLEEKPKSDG